jgi:probable rRNA maturation factor
MTVQCHIAHPDHKRIPNGINSVLQCVVKAVGNIDDEITVILSGSTLVRKLNRKFLGKNRSTDVLSFNMSESSAGTVVGEVYVNLDRIRKQALQFDVSFWNELIRLIIHGILHLYGYDDQNPNSRKRMIQRQEELVTACARPLHW